MTSTGYTVSSLMKSNFSYYFNIDKITLVKMILITKMEKQKLCEELDRLCEKAKEREAKTEVRNGELMKAYHSQLNFQKKLMDKLTDMQRQIDKNIKLQSELLAKLQNLKVKKNLRLYIAPD